MENNGRVGVSPVDDGGLAKSRTDVLPVEDSGLVGVSSVRKSGSAKSRVGVSPVEEHGRVGVSPVDDSGSAERRDVEKVDNCFSQSDDWFTLLMVQKPFSLAGSLCFRLPNTVIVLK